MTCARAARLISQALDFGLSARCRVGVAVHTLVCPKCRRFRRQATALDVATRAYLAGPAAAPAGLSAAARDRLRAAVRDHSAGD